MTDTLEARAVRFAYDGHEVLRGVSCAVEAGGVLGILGPNGAGKSTLLRLLAGLAEPTGGMVTVGGRSVRALPRREAARAVGFVPQREAVLFGLRVRELVALGRAPHTGWFGALRPEDHRAVNEALARCDLTGLAERAYATLSGGEQKRCLVARALAQRAPWLLLDEPVAHLDLSHQLDLCELLREVTAGGDTGVGVVLHDLNLAAVYCDRVLLLRDGEAVALGTVGEVLTPPRLRETFQVEVWEAKHPDGAPFFVPRRAPGGEGSTAHRGRVFKATEGG
ncbi:MAG: ABC transporter ATP-binding protein [Deltaproteobacteria bacterium]|nr:ABC transporter ATP-binding protein [Deltaproteobacteria bacterium]